MDGPDALTGGVRVGELGELVDDRGVPLPGGEAARVLARLKERYDLGAAANALTDETPLPAGAKAGNTRPQFPGWLVVPTVAGKWSAHNPQTGEVAGSFATETEAWAAVRAAVARAGGAAGAAGAKSAPGILTKALLEVRKSSRSMAEIPGRKDTAGREFTEGRPGHSDELDEGEGPAHGRWKTGRYSRYLPRGVAADYKRALTDPKLLELDAEVALLQARIAGLLRELGQVEAPPWGAAVESLNSLVLAVRDGEGIDDALAAHAAVVRQGADAAANHEMLWDKIQRTIDLKGRTSRLEWKRQMDLCQALPAAQVMTLVNGILAAVEDICTAKYGNKDVYRQICRAALFYLPPECRRPGDSGEVIDHRPADSNT
jgi:hypothetical protein